MKEYVRESEESFEEKIRKAKLLIAEESAKLYAEKDIKYEFDHYSGEVRLMFVKQTEFAGGKLDRAMLDPLVKRLKEIDKKWYVGVMLYGSRRSER